MTPAGAQLQPFDRQVDPVVFHGPKVGRGINRASNLREEHHLGANSWLGSDRLVVRDAGEYASRKLDFIDFFCPPAIDATESKHRRVYIDLFAGPGLNLVRNTGVEVEGACLRVLRAVGKRRSDLSFTDAHLVNIDPDDARALTIRLARLREAGNCRIPDGHVHAVLGDANVELDRVLQACHPLDYLLIFADIEAPSQLPWATVKGMRARGHRSVDLYVLFPLEMGLNRLTSYGEMPAAHRRIYTDFYGDETWRPILDRRITEAQAPECRRQLEELYLKNLRQHWEVAVQVMHVRKVGQQGLYRMLFATDHDAGAKIATWAKGQTDRRDQLDLLR
jgi:three-Cys-motif partner protein